MRLYSDESDVAEDFNSFFDSYFELLSCQWNPFLVQISFLSADDFPFCAVYDKFLYKLCVGSEEAEEERQSKLKECTQTDWETDVKERRDRKEFFSTPSFYSVCRFVKVHVGFIVRTERLADLREQEDWTKCI
jgi:hypothetical protein